MEELAMRIVKMYRYEEAPEELRKKFADRVKGVRKIDAYFIEVFDDGSCDLDYIPELAED